MESKLVERIQILEKYIELETQEKNKAPVARKGRIPRTTSGIISRDAAYIKKLKDRNTKEFFGPANASIELARQSIKKWDQNEYDIAIEAMNKAYNTFAHEDILFNLGKMQLANGDYEEGVVNILTYYKTANNYDFHKIELKSLFQVKENRRTMEGLIKGKERDMAFTVDSEQYVHFQDEALEFVSEIDLPFKLPLFLNAQRKDHEEFINEDYKYLKELFYGSNESEYELVIEKSKFPKFISDFYGTVLELASDERDIIHLAVFEELKMDLFLFNLRRQHYVNDSDEPAEVAITEDNSLISLLKVKLPFKNQDEFFRLYRDFARRNLISAETDWKMEEQYLDAESEKYAQAEMQREKYLRQLKYAQFIEHGKEYAKLKCVWSNIRREALEPFEFSEEEYRQFYNNYINRISPYYSDVIEEAKRNKKVSPDKASVRTIILNSVGEIKNKAFKEKLINQLIDIENQIKVNPNFSLNPMRVTLEGVIKEACLKKQIPILKDSFNPRSSRRLMELYGELKFNDLAREVELLVNKGNTGSHYDVLKSFISTSEEDARELFKSLLYCTSELIKKFDL